ncbi:GNAT family N-acetyltransferase [Terrilactibacillus sp. BCM23-1]|uniref:GNAT family N-acetyltransferase n=1 Tax=Terrilactibacillus tamarindi TaxID=2599694 RepID=A0A6N8CSH1_9BACI|nr:GNAT family N-acetyltransferase [Terrilactibacillus tamarindi]MTT31885.1 GNAT family N-acetyltransferase [Terrilactibacillus tamarindi]
MGIDYSFDVSKATKHQLTQLFKSLEWKSGNYPEKLEKAIQQSDSVVTAWDGDKLVGLVNALSDGILNVYFHYVLIHPNYQHRGIGKKLMNMMLEQYRDFPTKMLVSYPESVSFYKKLGFEIKEGSAPMAISELF